MSTAAMTLRLRPRPRPGPALRRAQIPALPLALSAVGHGAVIATLLLAATVWRVAQPKVYIVNLVPAVATVPAPQLRPTAPPRPAPAPRPAAEPRRPEPPRELPAREPSAARELPPPSRQLPARDRTVLPERDVPPRPLAAPRPGDKELPTLARAPAASRPVAPPAPSPPPAAPPAKAPELPAPASEPPSAPSSPGGLSLNVSDFPYTWYIQTVHRKIQERWEGRAIQGRQPEVIFEIARDGKLRGLSVSKSSGNPAYDQLALRAVSGASPFPPLPQGFDKPLLTIGLQFVYDPGVR